MTYKWIESLSALLAKEPQDRPELLLLLQDAQKRNLLDSNALAMIEGVLRISEMKVHDIMVPRSQMIMIQEHAPLADIIAEVVGSGHSRFPVIRESVDTVVGVLLAKDLLNFGLVDAAHFQLSTLLRPVIFVPEYKRIDALLNELRRSHQHLAIVADEYGSMIGLVTLEDIIEEIVGEIEDEHDISQAPSIQILDDGTYLVKGTMLLKDFNAHFKADFDEASFDTIAGFVLQQFGRLPRKGENIQVDHFVFCIQKATNRRIDWLRVEQNH